MSDTTICTPPIIPGFALCATRTDTGMRAHMDVFGHEAWHIYVDVGACNNGGFKVWPLGPTVTVSACFDGHEATFKGEIDAFGKKTTIDLRLELP